MFLEERLVCLEESFRRCSLCYVSINRAGLYLPSLLRGFDIWFALPYNRTCVRKASAMDEIGVLFNGLHRQMLQAEKEYGMGETKAVMTARELEMMPLKRNSTLKPLMLL